MAIICLEAPDLFGDVLRNHLLGIIIKYLSDPDNQASDSCFDYISYNKVRMTMIHNTYNMKYFCSVGATNGSKRAHDDREAGSSRQ